MCVFRVPLRLSQIRRVFVGLLRFKSAYQGHYFVA
jgi:hypothetical protein